MTLQEGSKLSLAVLVLCGGIGFCWLVQWVVEEITKLIDKAKGGGK